MDGIRIARLAACNFRGIRQAAIELDGRSLIVLGENGSGKSSWVDLIEYLLTGKLARLGRKDVDVDECLPFVGAEPGTTRVTMTCRAGEKGRAIAWEAETSYPYSQPVPSPAFAGWFALLQQHPPILRRSQILDFIDARGADRYEQVSDLIGLHDLDRIVKAWRDVQKGWEDTRDVERRNVDQASDHLRALRIPVLTEVTIIAEINMRLAILGLPPLVTMSGIAAVADMLREGQDSSASDEAVQCLSYVADVNRIDDELVNFAAAYRDFYAGWAAFAGQKEIVKQTLFSDLLIQAQRLISGQGDLATCPVCQSPIARDTLLLQLHERIAGLQQLHIRRDEMERSRDGLRQRLAGANQRLRLCLQSPYCSRTPALTHLGRTLDALNSALSADILDGSFPAPDAEPLVSCSQLLPSLRDELAELQEHALLLQPSQIDQQRIEMAVWLGQIMQAHDVWVSARQAVLRLQQRIDLIRHLTQMVVDARQEHIDKVHADIAETVSAYNEALHPNEGYQAVHLPMEREGRSVGLRTGFDSVSNTHPSAFYSEGHLDAMGLSIFLAFIKRFHQGAGLLILDDVLTTMDGDHRRRVARLLVTEFHDYQLIMTTHDPLWAAELKAAMITGGMDPVLLHLRSWHKEIGVTWDS